MWTQLNWVEGPWRGKLALSARPRGGDWLNDEISHWREGGVDTVFSLLTHQEEQDLNLANEQAEVTAHGMTFLSFPIPDREVPDSETRLTGALEELEEQLSSGRNVALHCRQGIGRAGLVAACLFLTKGIAPEVAVQRLSAARGIPIPETTEQRRWINRFATIFAGMR